MRFVAVCCCDIAAANSYLVATFLQQNCTAMDTTDIYHTINCYSRANTGYTNTVTIDTHAAVTFCFDIADCQRTVDNNISILTAYNDAANSTAFSSNIGNFYRAGNIQLRIIALSKNTICASSVIISCRNRQLLFDKRISNRNIGTPVYKNTCCLCACFNYRAQCKVFASHVYSHRSSSIICIKSSSKFAVAFGDGRFSYLDINYAVCVSLTGFANILGLFNSTGFVFRLLTRRLIVIIALAGFLRAGRIGREGNIAGLQCCGGSSKTVGNLYNALQVAICIVMIEQLACQVIQYACYVILCFSSIAVIKAGGNALIICNKGNSRTLLRLSNIEITADNLRRICSIMLIEYCGMTAIIYNRNRIVILLVNQACVGRIFAAV